jgi:hypothetical protein
MSQETTQDLTQSQFEVQNDLQEDPGDDVECIATLSFEDIVGGENQGQYNHMSRYSSHFLILCIQSLLSFPESKSMWAESSIMEYQHPKRLSSTLQFMTEEFQRSIFAFTPSFTRQRTATIVSWNCFPPCYIVKTSNPPMEHMSMAI